jgi:hypothetical protein
MTTTQTIPAPVTHDNAEARAMLLRTSDGIALAINCRPVAADQWWMAPSHPNYGQGYHQLAPLMRAVGAVRRIAAAPVGNSGDSADWKVLDEAVAFAKAMIPDARNSFVVDEPNRCVAAACLELVAAARWICAAEASERSFCVAAIAPDHENLMVPRAQKPWRVMKWAQQWGQRARELWGTPAAVSVEMPEVKVWDGEMPPLEKVLSVKWAEDGLRVQDAGGKPFRPTMSWGGKCPIADQPDVFARWMSPTGAALLRKYLPQIQADARRQRALWARFEAGQKAWHAEGSPSSDEDATWEVSSPISEAEIERWAPSPATAP